MGKKLLKMKKKISDFKAKIRGNKKKVFLFIFTKKNHLGITSGDSDGKSIHSW